MPDEPRTPEPALSPDEWKELTTASDVRAQLMVASLGVAVGDHLTFPLVMALANAALPDDDPRKITRGDVHNVEDAIGTIMMGVRVETLSVQGLWDLAAKLAALLPPPTG